MKRTLIFALAAVITSMSSGVASADPTMGTVATFAFGFCPRNWLPADGRLLSIQLNQALFSLYGTTYGGDGITTFGIPKVSMNTAPGSTGSRKLTTCITVAGAYPSRP